jgi:hypothetical protein
MLEESSACDAPLHDHEWCLIRASAGFVEKQLSRRLPKRYSGLETP